MKFFRKIKLLIAFIWACFWANHGIASSLDFKEVSFDDVLKAMLSNEKDDYSPQTVGSPITFYSSNGFLIFRGLKIRFDRQKDNPWDQRFSNPKAPMLLINKGIEFIDCEFPELYWFVLRKMTFTGPIGFRRCKNVFAFFRDCQFKHHFTIRGGVFNFLQAENCTFELGFDASEGVTIQDYILFEHCRFSYAPAFFKQPHNVEHQNVIGNLTKRPPFFQLINKNNPFALTFAEVTFELNENIPFIVQLKNSVFSSLEFEDCKVQSTLDLSFVNVENEFKFKNTDLKKKLLAESLNFNTANSKIDWNNLKGNKLAILHKDTIFSGENITQLDDIQVFNTLISVYAIFYTAFKSQGNRLFANASYIEWKDIETEFLGIQRHIQKHADVYFFWIMNVFLRVFCDYGTNPIESMVWSLYVIGAFACIYLFFPNANNLPDEYSYRLYIISALRYFSENKTLYEALLMNSASSQANTYEKRFIQKNLKNMPWFLRWFSIPVLWDKPIQYYKLQTIRKFNQYAGRWNEIPPFKKTMVSLVFTIFLLYGFLYIALIKTLNALMLSLNVFSTLGFGDIPIKGFAKYFTVIEGFIGWFLLSIFSVALISQIIQ